MAIDLQAILITVWVMAALYVAWRRRTAIARLLQNVRWPERLVQGIAVISGYRLPPPIVDKVAIGASLLFYAMVIIRGVSIFST